ncbi:GxxExxY protein [Paludibacter sp. 221]|uniref:GxxExxY protein n=1 Tax=Paludibacter sp. 221 TaxID=2302939 RepID=UPI0013D3DE53|nr:GxxExxY protein [Paludibacter sp. 221]NDV47498.1 GxxExxY protein [Paludibacter sp. 221]
MKTQAEINDLSYKIVGCAIEVNRNLGCGLPESIYEECFLEELRANGLKVDYQKKVPITYRGKELFHNLKLDLLVEDCIIVEIRKNGENQVTCKSRMSTYLKLMKKPKGMVINFNCENITSQVIALLSEEFAKLPKRPELPPLQYDTFSRNDEIF